VPPLLNADVRFPVPTATKISPLAVAIATAESYPQKRNADGVAPKTLFNEVIAIKQLLTFVVSRDLIASNPLKRVRMRRPKPPPQPFWTIEQVDAILNAAKKSPYFNVYLLLARTGMRISEVRYLTWKDVDLDRKLLFVREKQIGPKPIDVWKPKSGRQRVVPLSTDAVEMLAKLPHKCRWVFRQPDGLRRTSKSLQFNDRNVLTRLKTILKQLGLRGHVHSFRHSFVSFAVIRGVPEAVIREWVGHVDPAILRHYTHIADAASRQQMDRLFDRPLVTK
jgi:integrase